MVRWLAVVLAVMGGLQAVGGDHRPGAYQRMDYGPVISETIRAGWPEGNVAVKGLAIRLADESAAVFDTELLRYGAGIAAGWVDITATDYTSYKGTAVAVTEGREVFATPMLPGWALGDDFADPREAGGALPEERGRYHGYFRYGSEVILYYRVYQTEVLDRPRVLRLESDSLAFVRTLDIGSTAETLSNLLFQVPPVHEVEEANPLRVWVKGESRSLVAALLDAVDGASLECGPEGRVVLKLGPSPASRRLRVAVIELPGAHGALALEDLIKQVPLVPHDLNALTRGGPSQWPEPVVLQAEMAPEDAGYVVDRIPLPEANPWNSWFRPTGFDFFQDGSRAAVSTWNGDVWIVSGLGGVLEEVRWRRFASGLFYPMGVAIVDDEVYVIERSQLTRLRDLNGNGEADFYENLNNQGLLYPMAHSLCLEVDSEGNFYFFKNGNRVPEGVRDHGALFRVSPEGSRREVFARGIRGANSLGIGPDDQILAADQEGEWIPTTRVDWLRPDRFYGYPRHGRGDHPLGEFEPPICWIPHRVDNSTGALAFAGDSRWGPLSGRWVLASYGQCTLFALLTQTLGDRIQGGVVPFPIEFSSGLMRARVNPADGQLYLLGMRGWQTTARSDGSFDRVRYTGLPVYMPTRLEVRPRVVELTFSEPLDRGAAGELERYEVERWQYLYWRRYGSPEVSVEDPQRHARDAVEVTSVRLSEDGRTLLFDIPDLKPVMQMRVAYRVRFEDGNEAAAAVHHTIHRLTAEQAALPAAPLVVSDEELARLESAEGERRPERVAEGDPPQGFHQGRALYGAHCTTCHSVSAVAHGVAPPMAASRWAPKSEGALIRILLQGKVGEHGVMMPFSWLPDEDLAALLTYIRWNWHQASAVSPGQVAEIRRLTEDRQRPWSEEELQRLIQSLAPEGPR